MLPVDHPWWETHAPPNGWNCRCTLVQLSERDLDRYGYSVSPDPEVVMRSWHNRRTGRTVQVPRGIDPGFAHNPGTLAAADASARIFRAKVADAGDIGRAATADARTLAAAVAEIDRLPDAAGRARVAELLGDARFGAQAAGIEVGDWPVAALAASTASALDTSARAVQLSGWTAAKQVYRHPELSAADYARVQRMLDEGTLYRGRSPRHLVAVHRDGDGQWWRAVVKATAVELYLVSLHRMSDRNARQTERNAPPFGVLQ